MPLQTPTSNRRTRSSARSATLQNTPSSHLILRNTSPPPRTALLSSPRTIRCHYGRRNPIPPRGRQSIPPLSRDSTPTMSDFLESIKPSLPTRNNVTRVDDEPSKIQGVVDALKCAMDCPICRGMMEKPFV